MTNAIERALRYAAAAHQGQVRKNSGVPYITHPMSVAMMVAVTCPDEATVMAAALHDVLEDTPITYEQLTTDMGPEVANLVSLMTENKTLPWRTRKIEKVNRLCAEGGDKAKLICLADNYHNMLCTVVDGGEVSRDVVMKHKYAMDQCRKNSTHSSIIWVHYKCVEVHDQLRAMSV